jgi:hypothetical protein
MKVFYILIVLLFILTNCVESEDKSEDYFFNNTKVKMDEFDIYSTSLEEDFYFSGSHADSLFYNYTLCDSAGILMSNYNNKDYYNPVQIARRALYFVSTFHGTKDTIFLNWAEKYANKLIELSDEVNNSLLFPYDFDFPLHGYEKFTMEAPWYSAMAQGEVLSLFSKLYTITNNNYYLEKADLIFNSFYLQFDGVNSNHNWISAVDTSNYLWLEEYPFNPVNYTLNGFLFAIIGVYDYYRINNNARVYKLLCAVLTSARDNIARFRSEGEISYYCIAHDVQSESYHSIHIKQIEWLYLITNNKEFKKQSDLFREDF